MLNLSDYLKKPQNNKEKNYLIIFGAGTIGKLTLEALKIKNIKVDFFCDSDVRKQDKEIDKKPLPQKKVETRMEIEKTLDRLKIFNDLDPMMNSKNSKNEFKEF